MKYTLSELYEAENLQSFFDSLFDATNISCKIITNNGNALIESGFKDIWNTFQKFNIENEILSDIQAGKKYSSFQWEDQLIFAGIQINIQEKHMATLYFGQLLPIEKSWEIIINFMLNVVAVFEKIGFDTLQEHYLNRQISSNYQELEATYEELVATEEELRAQFEELQLSKKKLKQSEERYKLALLGSHDGIWDWDIVNDSYYYSEKWANMLGYTKKTLPLANRSWKELIHPMDLELFEKVVNDYITKKTDRYKCEYRIKRKDNSYIWVSDVGAATWDEQGLPIRMVGSHTDITEQKKALEQIHQLAYYDDLTKLPNKFALQEQINKLCKDNDKFAIIFISLDNFKSINDLFSHTIGDSLLKKLSSELSSLANGNDQFLYRWGGDEFVILLKNIDNDSDLINYLETLAKFINRTITINENEIFISASIGACLHPRDGKNLEELIKNSNAAKYHAKTSGKNTYKIYCPELFLKVMEQITLERELRLALKRNEFQVYYQPRISIKDNKLVGAEALLRWVKPNGTIISPLKVIPKAEETGLIVPIGEFVIKSSCQQLKNWLDKGYSDLTISINLSVKQIEDPNLIDYIRSAIEETGVKPSNLEFEITESAAINDLNQTLKLLKELKDMGIKVLLDDFGTGYSSLNFLRLLPVTTIKIDKSFIDKVLEDSMERTIVQSLISLAHAIRMNVIAEGIEQISQLCFLKEISCDEAQGFYFSRPIPAEQFEKMLEDYNK